MVLAHKGLRPFNGDALVVRTEKKVNMASLEHVCYVPHRPLVVNNEVELRPLEGGTAITELPQIFWKDGTPWLEACLWAHERATSREIKIHTVQTEMRHLHAYANFLDTNEEIDWRHFPRRKADRVLVLWRDELIKARDAGKLASSTASQRMSATIRFYRFAAENNLVSGNPFQICCTIYWPVISDLVSLRIASF